MAESRQCGRGAFVECPFVAFDAIGVFSRQRQLEFYAKETKCAKERCIDFFSISVHVANSVSVGVVFGDEVFDSTGDCKRGLGGGPDDV